MKGFEQVERAAKPRRPERDRILKYVTADENVMTPVFVTDGDSVGAGNDHQFTIDEFRHVDAVVESIADEVQFGCAEREG